MSAVVVVEMQVGSEPSIAFCRVRANVESLAILSIGGAIFPADGATVDALFQTADERPYAAKRSWYPPRSPDPPT